MNKDISQILQATISFLCPLVLVNPALAQNITPDGTVPTQINQSGNVTEITGGAERGNNLFHSFQEFSIPTGNEAFFNNATTIENIFSRVTGGSISDIDGLIRANGSANLFLLNPAGILFGANARLDIGGSFYGSTADSLLFDEGIEFSAVNPQNPVLTINAPIGLRFRDNPAAITNRSIEKIIGTDSNGAQTLERGLLVKANQTLALVGGDIKLEKKGILSALTGGKIDIGGLSTRGTVSFNEDGSLSFPEGITKADVSLVDSTIGILDVREKGGISINARNVTLSGSEVPQSSIIAFNITSSQQMDRAIISINASEKVSLTEQSVIFGQLTGNAVGRVKGIEINTGFLEIVSSTPPGESPAQITLFGQTPTIVQDNVDVLTINASEKISINQGAIQIQTIIGGGQKGNATISTGSLELTNNAVVFLNNAIISGEIADPGSLNINADRILVENSTISTFLGEVLASDIGTDIEINANSLELNGGTLNAATATGTGGNIKLDIDDKITLSNSSQITARATGNANGGRVDIETEQLTVQSDSVITASTEGEGSGGVLEIEAESLNLNRGTIAAETTASTGGNIKLDVDDNITLRNNSQITASATGDADGGNIDIDADLIIASPNQNNDILASAGQEGTGGRIVIEAEGVLGIEERPENETTNDIDASGGVDGEVIINTPDVDISKGVLETPQNVLVLEQIVAQACSADGIAKGRSTLVVNGKGGVAPELTATISSDDIYIEGKPVNAHTEAVNSKFYADIKDKEKEEKREIVTLTESSEPVTIDDIIPARGAIILENGDVVLTAYPTSNSGYRSSHSRANCTI